MFVKNYAKVVKIFRRLMVDRFNNFRCEIKQILNNLNLKKICTVYKIHIVK